MNARLPYPALMDGDISTYKAMEQRPTGTCPELWLLEHPEVFQDMAADYTRLGSTMICTPSDTADRSHLEVYGLGQQTVEINTKLAQLTVEACKSLNKDVLVAGCVSPLKLHAQPFGDTPFLDIVNIYAEQAFALKNGGVDLLVADNMTSLSHCRAAILACKQTGLPVVVILNVEDDGESDLGCDLVAALIVCQSLGVDAFGLSCREMDEELFLQQVEEMAPYAMIPLVVKPDAGNTGKEKWAQIMCRLRKAGAAILGGGKGVSPEYIEELEKQLEEGNVQMQVAPLDTDSIFMAGETEPYFLDEFFEQSDPIVCGFDMADELLAAEDDEFDVITIQIDSMEDAWNFAENGHMLHKPVSFLSDSEEALEMALLMYNGRAFVDSRSNMDEDVLSTIAKGYGAIVR